METYLRIWMAHTGTLKLHTPSLPSVAHVLLQ